MNKPRPEKKTEMIEVRLPHSKKAAFRQACEEEGITVSHAVRTFVDAYLRRSRRMKAKRIARDISMTLIRNPIKTTSGVGGTLAGIAAMIALTASPSFADRDVQPIQHPAPVYPADLASQSICVRGIAGHVVHAELKAFVFDAEGVLDAGVEFRVCEIAVFAQQDAATGAKLQAGPLDQGNFRGNRSVEIVDQLGA